MVLKGLLSVSINLFVMYTLTTAEFLPKRDLKGLVKFIQNIIILFFVLPMRFCETCATMQSMFTWYDHSLSQKNISTLDGNVVWSTYSK